jgi:hypothetical protein
VKFPFDPLRTAEPSACGSAVRSGNGNARSVDPPEGREYSSPPAPLSDEVEDELAESLAGRERVAWNIAANPHLDQESARDTIMRYDRSIARLRAMRS